LRRRRAPIIGRTAAARVAKVRVGVKGRIMGVRTGASDPTDLLEGSRDLRIN
jgi:hypothetical protein